MAKIKTEFKDIIEYYDHTRADYKRSWDNSPTPAVHFGYYETNSEKHADALMNTNRVLAEMAHIQAGDKVLDAGCGKGGSSFWLALHKDVEAIGITPVQSQIDDCNAQAKKLNLADKTSFVLADYCDTPFPNEHFDVVWACESLCHAKDKSLFYQEAYRLLRPGGRLIIAEYLRSKRPLTITDDQLLKSWLNRWAIDDIDTQEEHIVNAEKTGFQQVNVKDVTSNMNNSLRNLHRNSKKWLWLSEVLKTLHLRSKVEHANMYASIKQYEALQQNIWFYAFISAVKP